MENSKLPDAIGKFADLFLYQGNAHSDRDIEAFLRRASTEPPKVLAHGALRFEGSAYSLSREDYPEPFAEFMVSFSNASGADSVSLLVYEFDGQYVAVEYTVPDYNDESSDAWFSGVIYLGSNPKPYLESRTSTVCQQLEAMAKKVREQEALFLSSL